MKKKLILIFRWLFSPQKPPFKPSGKKQLSAFISKGSFSHANARILKALGKEFPEIEFEPIDLDDILRENKTLCLLNVFQMFWVYRKDLLARRRSLRECFFRTPFLFAEIKRIMPSRIRSGIHIFALQTQSYLDYSVPGVPHFVYADHTHLTNLCYPAFDPRRLLPARWLALERSIYANAAKVFVMTHHVERTLLEQYGCEPSKVVCIHSGSNTEPIPEGPPEPRQQRILFVGLNWRRKGGPQLLEAFLSITGKFPEAKLVIVGCNPPVEHPNVEILGRVPLQTVQKEYLKAQIFAFPTRIEPAGFVVIEAMMHKLPVIGTPVGVLPDIVRDGESGYLVEPDDIEGLASVLAELLSDPEKCRRFGEHGYQIACKEYSWEAVGAALRKGIGETLNAEP